MDKATAEIINTLAAKLGTTAEYLWAAMLRQAPISAFTTLAIMAAWIAAVVWFWRFLDRKQKAEEWSEDGLLFAWVLLFFAVLFCAFIVSVTLPHAVQALLNPEYWALRQLLK